LIVSTGFAVISAQGVPYTYLYHALTTDEFVGYLTNHATGAAYPAVTARDFENAEVLHPAKSVLARFHETVEPCLILKETLNRKNENLRRTRDLLLPKLISGEVDVSALDVSMPEKENGNGRE
jgi:type I restriction enzyme S subunit